jgi:hypothetical protein
VIYAISGSKFTHNWLKIAEKAEKLVEISEKNANKIEVK